MDKINYWTYPGLKFKSVVIPKNREAKKHVDTVCTFFYVKSNGLWQRERANRKTKEYVPWLTAARFCLHKGIGLNLREVVRLAPSKIRVNSKSIHREFNHSTAHHSIMQVQTRWCNDKCSLSIYEEEAKAALAEILQAYGYSLKSFYLPSKKPVNDTRVTPQHRRATKSAKTKTAYFQPTVANYHKTEKNFTAVSR